MKTIIDLKCGALIFFLFLNCSFAQNYFPSEVGIKYQTYHSSYDGGNNYSYRNWHSHIIDKDSIISGKRFVKFKQNSYGPYSTYNLYHYDQTEQKLFMKVPGNDTIRLAVDFNAAAGDSFISYLRENKPYYFHSQGIINYQGHITYKIRVSVRQDHWTYHEEYYWKEDLGLLYVYKNSINWASQYTSNSGYRVYSAILSDTLFDPIILNITTLSPIENRLVTQFPFIMNGDYISTLPGGGTPLPLIDSFYVKVIHLRQDDTLGTYKFPFNSSKLAFINLTPQEFDVLLVKAYISDTTIFRNTDTFPDTGYAEILVLPVVTDVEDYNSPIDFKLEQNYPNPFNPVTTISYNVAEQVQVKIIVYDLLGNEVRELVNEEKVPGSYKIIFNAEGLSSGMYYYTMTAGEKTFTRKMIILK